MTAIKIDQIIRSKRRSLGLEITLDARLIIRAPRFTSLRRIYKTIGEKKNWIEKKQELMKRRKKGMRKKKFISGEEFLYLGKKYPLLVAEKGTSFNITKGFFHIPKSHQKKAREIFKKWYRQQATCQIPRRVKHYANLAGLKPKQIKITSAKKRWGSCGARGNLCFAWRLVMAPLKVVDYVVVHELSHLKESNHSKKFWRQVEETLPDYKEQEKWLKEEGYRLNL